MSDDHAIEILDAICEAAAVVDAERCDFSVEDRLGADGRLVLRYSGTEPLARVMIEGPDQETVEALAGGIAEAIAAEIGAARLAPR